MADQSLVPKDRPYGERQNTVESMRRAGLPLSPRNPAPGAAPSPAAGPAEPRPTPPAFDPLLETRPDMFPTLGGGPSNAPAIQSPMNMSAQDAFLQVASNSSSGVLRSIAMRLAQR